jgi:lipid II:glycine glycyltransferase (peptidoglycan interpeptide bridge formation enzyme)
MNKQAEAWDRGLDERASPAPLLQSWAWGEVQGRSGWSIERVRLGEAMASVQLRKIGPAVEAYVPRGPVPPTTDALDMLVAHGRQAGWARLLVEPEAPNDLVAAMKEREFVGVEAIQPEHTRIVKLLPRDQLLATFKHGRRYNIRTGIRRGVTVEEGRDAAELARQSAAVERRESINLPHQDYYQLLLDLLPWCRTYTARGPETGEPLASVLVARHAGRAYSLFAGRSGRRSELMGNDLAWWSAIAAAGDAGCADFDLWGVPPPDAAADHPWHGLGAFKAEFGGTEIAYVGAWEKVLSGAGAKLLGAERRARAIIRGLKRNIP